MDAGSTIRADATASGKGGDVVVWSDAATRFAGTISARGGAQRGDGGQAEVSSKGTLSYDGTTILTAAKGRFGTLLLDPYSITITNGSDANGGFDGASPTSTYTPTGTSVISATTLQAQLATANVVVSTGGAGSPGTDAGDITVAAPVSWSSNSVLTLQAYHSIAVNANLTVAGGGGLVLTTNNGGTGGTLTFAQGASATFQSNANQASQSLTINGQAYTLIRSMADL
ncbi:hypothetical protein VP06_33170, partial [Methylobacterium aquaticum]